MKEASIEHPAILIDFKKPRIRIHKKALYALGNPEYVLLLVNPVSRLIAIKVGERSDPRVHHLSWSAAVHKKSFEIYSVAFMDELRLCSDWDENEVYRINGNVIEKCRMIQFRIDDSVQLPRVARKGNVQ